MHLVVVAWLYVTLMMALADATSPQGSVLSGLATFAFFGLLPLSLLLYIWRTPARKRAQKAKAALEHTRPEPTPPTESAIEQPPPDR